MFSFSRKRKLADKMTPSDDKASFDPGSDVEKKPAKRAKKSDSAGDSKESISSGCPRFDNAGDDTSDDEADDIATHDIGMAWSEYEKEHFSGLRSDKMPNRTQYLYAFVTNAEGTKLRRHPKATELYYSEMKPKYLTNDSSSQLRDIIQKAFLTGLEKTTQYLHLFFKHKSDSSRQQNDFKEIHPFLENKISTNLSKLTDHVVKNVRTEIKESKSAENNKLFKATLKLMGQHSKQLVDQCCELFTESMQSNFMLHTAYSVKNAPEQVKKLQDALYEQAIRILKKEHVILENDKNRTAKDNVLDALNEKKSDFTSLMSTVKKIADEWVPRGYFYNCLEQHKESIAKAFLKDVIKLDQAGNPFGWDLTLQNKTNKLTLLRLFLNINADKLNKIFRLEFIKNIKRQLFLGVRSYNRIILDDSFQYESMNPVSFFASRLLFDRSKRREIKNLLGGDFASGYVGNARTTSVRTLRFKSNIEKPYVRLQAIENQQVLSTSFARLDKVLTMGTYEQILNKIEKIKRVLNAPRQNQAAEFKFNDQKIAQYVRSIFKGEFCDNDFIHLNRANQKFVFDHLSGLTYLLFGCESTRNPAMFILTQMMLDLIIAGRLTWKDALDVKQERNGLMPMAPLNSTNAARDLGEHFKPYMPDPHYSYDYSKEVKKEKEAKKSKKSKEVKETKESVQGKSAEYKLVTLEATMVHKWLLMHEQASSLHTSKKRAVLKHVDEELKGGSAAQALSSLITAHYDVWFDLPVSAELEIKSSASTVLDASESENNTSDKEDGSDSEEKDQNDINEKLIFAASQGDYKQVVKLIDEEKADVNYQDDIGYTALHHATECDDVKMVRFLLSRDAEVDLEALETNASIGDAFPLHIAAHNGNVEIIEMLVEADDSRYTLDAYEYCDFTPLHEAILEGEVAAAKKLIELGADVNCPTGSGAGIIDIAEGLTALDLVYHMCKIGWPGEQDPEELIEFLEKNKAVQNKKISDDESSEDEREFSSSFWKLA